MKVETSSALAISRSPFSVCVNSTKLISLLESLDQMITDTPPVQQPARFGNAAFRLWYSKVHSQKDALLKEILPERLHNRIGELAAYFVDSFGANFSSIV